MRHKLKTARLLLGYESPTQIAADAGMTREGFRHIENGIREPQGATRVAIISAMKGRREALVEGKRLDVVRLEQEIVELQAMAIDETLFEEGDGDALGTNVAGLD